MSKKKETRSERKIIFSKDIDADIGGVALGMAFIVVAIFITFNSDYLINETVTTVVRWLILLFGVPITIAILLSKAKCDSNLLATGIFLSGLWLLQYIYLDFMITRILGLLLLFLASFLIIQQLFFLIYSFGVSVKNIRSRDADKADSPDNTGVANSIFRLIATILGLFLVGIQMLQQLEVI